jgi:hypothetical protein
MVMFSFNWDNVWRKYWKITMIGKWGNLELGTMRLKVFDRTLRYWLTFPVPFDLWETPGVPQLINKIGATFNQIDRNFPWKFHNRFP